MISFYGSSIMVLNLIEHLSIDISCIMSVTFKCKNHSVSITCDTISIYGHMEKIILIYIYIYRYYDIIVDAPHVILKQQFETNVLYTCSMISGRISIQIITAGMKAIHAMMQLGLLWSYQIPTFMRYTFMTTPCLYSQSGKTPYRQVSKPQDWILW